MTFKKLSPVVIGMALFAMFFGSGNLIYPLFIGESTKDFWISGTLGFLLAAVVLPFLGVIAMVVFKGSYSDFFSCLGKRLGFLLSLLLLTVWIPLGSAPRCIALSYASINSYISIFPIWVYSLIYSLVLFFVITRKMGFLNILGRYITPLLLAAIGIVFIMVIVSPVKHVGTSVSASSLVTGMLEGYNTMDLIASFFFSASIIHILCKKSSMKKSLKLIINSSVIGMLILAVVYICLIFAAAKYSSFLSNIPKDQLLSTLSQVVLGPKFSAIAIVAIVLACFSTSVALVVAYADFLKAEVFKQEKTAVLSILLALVISFVMSLTGLEGITFVTAPILKICYPILILLIIYNFIRVFIQSKKMTKK